MTQVSLYGDIPNDIQVEAHSDSDDDDENQNEEIRQRLMDGLPEESFEFDDCGDSSENDSRSSSVNHNNNSGFLFNQDMSRATSSKVGIPVNGSYTASNNNSFTNGVNLNMLPNTIMDGSDNHVYPLKVNGNGTSSDFGAALHGHAKLNGNLVNGYGASHINNTTKPKKQVTIVESFQKNRGQDEIEESNPTISLLHQQHCPRTENGGHINSEMLSAADNKEEQMQSLLDTRARQLERSEEEVLKLQKDKRSLSHQVGLMKTELNHMKNQHDEAGKVIKLREQDCEYLRSKLHEAIEDYEQARAQEIAARDKAAELESEVGRLKEEVHLLSSIGSSTHQAEVSDIVRQLREKHATEIVSWKKVVNDLEGQVRTYKRQQQLLAEESFRGTSPMQSNASCQTDENRAESVSTYRNVEDQHRIKETTKVSFLKDEGNGDVFIKEKIIVSLKDKLQEIERRFEEEKEQIKDTYQKEVDLYRHKLAALPGELYKEWEAKQAELGIAAYFESRPICVDAFTSIDHEDLENIDDNYLKFGNKRGGGDADEFQDADVQVNFPSLLANRESAVSPSKHLNSPSHTSSVLVQTSEKETSSVIIQTDETLETYKILGTLLTTWSSEVQTAKANEEECIIKCRKYEEDINKLQKNFKLLHKVATKCRKESKLKEENLNKEITTMKSRYMEVLQKLNEKLDVLA